MNDPQVQVSIQPAEEGGHVLRLEGRLTVEHASETWRRIREEAEGTEFRAIDLGALETTDVAGVAVIFRAQRLGGEEAPLSLRNVPDAVAGMLGRLDAEGLFSETEEEAAGESPNLIAETGALAVSAAQTMRDLVTFVGETTAACGRALRSPGRIRWRETLLVMERAGFEALPIVLLINFLVGLVMGFQAALQLKRFGADIYIADLVGLATVRELGPLMTAIIVAGRSGSAFAAEIGTMKLNEEVDALRTMGLDPLRFLTVPKLIALVCVLPCLTLFADVISCFGGGIVGVLSLDLTPVAYWRQTVRAMDLVDVYSGIFKAGVFAVLVAGVGCFMGFQTKGGAQGVGVSTTRAVVLGIFFIIVADAIFTILFHVLGI